MPGRLDSLTLSLTIHELGEMTHTHALLIQRLMLSFGGRQSSWKRERGRPRHRIPCQSSNDEVECIPTGDRGANWKTIECSGHPPGKHTKNEKEREKTNLMDYNDVTFCVTSHTSLHREQWEDEIWTRACEPRMWSSSRAERRTSLTSGTARQTRLVNESLWLTQRGGAMWCVLIVIPVCVHVRVFYKP